MPIELLAFVPTGLAITLIALAHGLKPKPQGWALIGALAMLTGPFAVALLGFFLWLMVVAAAAVATTMRAALRYEHRRAAHDGM